MKTLETLKKDFKLLFRSRETSFMIIFGPLLIILLVGFAFSGSQEIDVSLGVYAPVHNDLTDQFIQSLNKDYLVNIYSTESECISSVEESKDHLCILFPQEFVIKDNHTNDVEFVLDLSRINLAYSIIDDLNTEFGLQNTELSKDLTNRILTSLTTTRNVLIDQYNNTLELRELRNDVQNNLRETEGHFEAEQINVSSIDLKVLKGRATGISDDARRLYEISLEELDNAISVLKDLKSECDDCENATKDKIEESLTKFRDSKVEIDGIYEETPDKLSLIYSQIDSVSKTLSDMEYNYDIMQEDSELVIEKINIANKKLDDMKDGLFDLKASINYTNGLLSGIILQDVDSIVSPITTSIRPVSSQENKLVFMYPYVLMLVIMFMGLMLGSTLVVSNKNSRAAFRNFTTSTRDGFQVAMSFIMTSLILLGQVIVIFIASYFLVSTPLFNNLETTILIICLSITLFSFLGMILGYLSKSQEGSMIASLTLGSIMLFISNLVIPIEGMNSIIKLFTLINPYVVLSEILKKSILFNAKLGSFGSQLTIIFVIAFLFLILVIAVQKYSRKKYFQNKSVSEVKLTKQAAKILEINGKEIKDEYDLLTVLDFMTRKEFETAIDKKDNIISNWVLNELGNKRLARKLRTTSKERMILRLDAYLKKMTKKQIK